VEFVTGTLALALRARLCEFSVRSESNRWSIHRSQRAHTSMPVAHRVQGIIELNNDAHGGENQGADAYYRRQNSFPRPIGSFQHGLHSLRTRVAEQAA
jgi:hypothetical protein